MGVCPPIAVLSTYRLQLGPNLSFDGVCEWLPYFRDLGISHLYLSPCLKAVAGSTHGYDVVDFSEVSPQLGGQSGFEGLCRASKQFGIGLLLDMVPNHMATAARQNPYWWDVLANGRLSRFAGYFDIRWDHPDPHLHGRVLLPILGDEIERCLESRSIRIGRNGPEIFLCYFEHELPLNASSLFELLQAANQLLHNPTLAENLARVKAAGISAASLSGPLKDFDDAASAALDAAIASINVSPKRLKPILDLQHYQLAFWRHANCDLNYRRFFDIHHLIGLCVEKEEVFAASHKLVLDWIKEGRLTGLRIDHPDGMRDPKAYLKRLRAQAPEAYIVIEKILEPAETLVQELPVAGTTGYDFLNRVNGLFIDPKSERPLTDFYAQFTGQAADYQNIVNAKKLFALEFLLASELSHLQDILADCLSRRSGPITFQPKETRRALAQVIACFPVYRTYIQSDTGNVEVRDQEVIRAALAAAKKRQPDIAPELWQWIEDFLLLKASGQTESEFVLRFQQLTGPVMAKGVEDTTFYCFNRLIALNEVGGRPDDFGTLPCAFHEFCLKIQSQWPRTLLASTTHDTKRSEDTRIRIALLSEIPLLWEKAVRRWSGMNARFCHNGFPDKNMEYFLYQTLVGAFPIGCDRLWPAMQKAAREAKVHTSWTDPNPVYEQALHDFVQAVLCHCEFTADLSDFLEPLSFPAAVTSLSQTLIKCTAPGVPDIYQGTELWDLALVDPDNRRSVDFALRRRLLAEIADLALEDILKRHTEGLPKMFLLKRVLSVRNRLPAIFGPNGDYRPLFAQGQRADHLVAFMRGQKVVTLALRLAVGLAGDWKDTVVELPKGTWKNEFSGQSVSGGKQSLTNLLARFPVALLSQ